MGQNTKVGFKNLDPVIVDNDTMPEELMMHSDEKNLVSATSKIKIHFFIGVFSILINLNLNMLWFF